MAFDQARGALRDPARADALLAAPLVAAALIQALAAPIADNLAVGLAIGLLTTVPVAFRRTRPVAAALVSTAAGLIPSDGYVYVGYVAAFVVFYSVAAHVGSREAVAATVVAGCGLAVAGSVIHGAAFGEYFGALSAVAAPAIVGRFVRHQRIQAARLRDLTEQLEREREQRVAAAVSDERARIARELHDVIAHEVSVIAIQSDAAEAALGTDPELARAPLLAIRDSAVAALAEMRRLLSVLRDPDDPAGEAPQPGLAQLRELVERAAALGIDVEVDVDGTPRAIPASVDLSAYRILQEALTNVHKHAHDAPAAVRVSWGADRLRLEVRNRRNGAAPAAPDGGGHGLVGMRERARVLGGSLEAGAAPDGGFVVTAVLPLRGAP
jgi:signal transduction histidine kinase